MAHSDSDTDPLADAQPAFDLEDDKAPAADAPYPVVQAEDPLVRPAPEANAAAVDPDPVLTHAMTVRVHGEEVLAHRLTAEQVRIETETLVLEAPLALDGYPATEGAVVRRKTASGPVTVLMEDAAQEYLIELADARGLAYRRLYGV